MKLKQLKALESITTKSINGIKPREVLEHVYMRENHVYAANDFMVFEIECNEISPDNPNYYNWVRFDLEACERLEKRHRYVNLNDPAALDFSEAAEVRCNVMGDDYFSRFFILDYTNIAKVFNSSLYYDAGLLQLVCKVFRAFKIDICITHNADKQFTVFTGSDPNYSIRALVMPKKVG